MGDLVRRYTHTHTPGKLVDILLEGILSLEAVVDQTNVVWQALHTKQGL